MSTYTQANRQMEVVTPLGKDKLMLVGLEGFEGISQLFNFKLELIGKRDEDPAFDKLLGESITVRLDVDDKKKRFLNGVCARFVKSTVGREFATYEMEIVPKFWFLTRISQSRIFQHLSVPDILKKVLTGLDVTYEIQGTFEKRDYCVQYRESDFAFASRLMEEEGIYYFFKHDNGSHKMVLANTPQSHTALDSKLMFDTIEGGVRGENRIFSWRKFQEVATGKVTLWDHCFELPHKKLETTKPIVDSVAIGEVTHKLKLGANGQFETYDYPGAYAQRFDGINKGGGDQAGELQKIFTDNKRTNDIRMQQQQVPSIRIQAESTCRSITSGFKLEFGTVEGDDNGKLLKAHGKYIITTARHSARVSSNYLSGDWHGFEYLNQFTAIPEALPFRPSQVTPKPVIVGTQTAVVVGPAGQEIFTDKYGRIKVQFHWDRDGKYDSDSSCWCRVGQVWAGKRWGASFWPRIGQEVIVTFEEGDPDRPIVVGSVYNADQMPPYLGDGLDSKHKNDNKVCGIKSNTTLGGVGYNEWRFDDTKGAEQIYTHAERNFEQRVRNETMEITNNHRHLIVGGTDATSGKKEIKADQREQVWQDKHLNVKRHQEEHIEGSYKMLVGHGKGENPGNVDIKMEKNKKELIGEDSHLHVKQNMNVLVDQVFSQIVGGNALTLIKGDAGTEVKGDCKNKIGGVLHHNVGGNVHLKSGGDLAIDAGLNVHIKAGMCMVLEAGLQISLKVGGNFVDVGPTGVAINGTMVLINSGGSAGSGSGCNPEDPAAPTQARDATDAKPTVPTEADFSKSGLKSCS
ncbi:MAG TPA: type VI secretion system tip protein TssI/VgrG [Gemmatales bacterium]|nr:type VI secretion system tip protein TssI/VgrG [Gemmatales bacterium]HMP61184.1 type VI secretion system tip protein TssI/VgrG [Gemmatales bacterium]